MGAAGEVRLEFHISYNRTINLILADVMYVVSLYRHSLAANMYIPAWCSSETRDHIPAVVARGRIISDLLKTLHFIACPVSCKGPLPQAQKPAQLQGHNPHENPFNYTANSHAIPGRNQPR